MTNLHETDRPVERLDRAQYEAVHRAAIDAYEAASPADFRYSAVALRKAVDAAFRTLTAMGGKAEPVGYIDRKQLDLIETQGRTDMATIWLEPYVPGHVALFASPVQARTGEVMDDMVERACVGYWPSHWAQQMSETDKTSIRVHMRKALEAVLSSNESNKQ